MLPEPLVAVSWLHCIGMAHTIMATLCATCDPVCQLSVPARSVYVCHVCTQTHVTCSTPTCSLLL